MANTLAPLSLGPLILQPASLDPLALTAEQNFDDIIDSPDWDTYPTPGVATNWSVVDGNYTMEAQTPTPQVIQYQDWFFRDGTVSCTLLNPWDHTFGVSDYPDMFLAARIRDADNYWGACISDDGVRFVEVVAGAIVTIQTFVPAAYPATVQMVMNDRVVDVSVNGQSFQYISGNFDQYAGRVGIIARPNNATPPIETFSNLTVQGMILAPAFSLDFANLPGSVTTVGTRYVWNGTNYQQYVNGGTPPVIGSGNTITKTIAGAVTRPIYPEFLEGGTANAGDVFWHQNQSGDVRIVQLQSPPTTTIPKVNDLIHSETQGQDAVDGQGNTWRSGAVYESEFGVYLEPELNQRLLNPLNAETDLRNGAIVTGGTVPCLIEGAPATAVIRGTAATHYAYMDSLLSGTVSENFGLVAVIQLISSDDVAANASSRVALHNGGPAISQVTIYWNTGEVDISSGVGYYRWRGNNTVEVWTTAVATGSGRIRCYVYPFATGTGGSTNDIAVHVANVAQTPYPWQPIAVDGVRPAESAWTIGDNATLWSDLSMNTAGTVLSSGAGLNGNPDVNWIDMITNAYSVHASDTDVGFLSKESGQTAVRALDVGATDPRPRHRYTSYSGLSISIDQMYAGGPSRAASGTYNGSGYTAGAGDARLLSRINGAAPLAPMILRDAAWWSVADAFDFVDEFGPGNYKGLPSFPT